MQSKNDSRQDQPIVINKVLCTKKRKEEQMQKRKKSFLENVQQRQQLPRDQLKPQLLVHLQQPLDEKALNSFIQKWEANALANISLERYYPLQWSTH